MRRWFCSASEGIGTEYTGWSAPDGPHLRASAQSTPASATQGAPVTDQTPETQLALVVLPNVAQVSQLHGPLYVHGSHAVDGAGGVAGHVGGGGLHDVGTGVHLPPLH